MPGAGYPNGGYVAAKQPPVVQQTIITSYELGKESVKVRCNYCSNEMFTRVDSKISSNGMAWALLCLFCGSWLLSLLVLCMDGFREFLHYCPSCNALIGVYKPTFSGGLVCLLVMLSFLVIGLQILLIIFVFVPYMNYY